MRVDFEKLSALSRIWIYQSANPISEGVEVSLKKDLNDFISNWTAHQDPLLAWADIYHNRFLVLVVDEDFNKVSGCSIDSSVLFIKSLEQKYKLDLFDRFTFSYEKDGEVITVPKDRFAELYQSGEINESTLVFDNLIRTKEELQSSWKKPLGECWMRRFVK